MLLVANHFNGFVDPVLIATALRRLPRFIAKAGLRKIPIAGLVLRSVGVVFVHRRVDSDGRESESREQRGRLRRVPPGARQARRRRHLPRGHHPRPGPDRPDQDRRGAHRAGRAGRGRRATWPSSPVGLTFPDKVALRSSALVQFGLPIDLDVVAPDGVGPDDTDAVRQLTGIIDRGIRAVSPDFPDVETALALDQAAQVALSSPDDPDPSLEARADLARRLGRVVARRAGGGAPGRRPLPHHPRRPPPHRRRRHPTDQPRAPAPLGVLDRRARRRSWAGSSPPPRW